MDLSNLDWVTPLDVVGIAAIWVRLSLAGDPPDVILPKKVDVRSYLVDVGLDRVIPGHWGTGGGCTGEEPWLKLSQFKSSNEWDDRLRTLWPEAAIALGDPKLTTATIEIMSELIDNATTHGNSDVGTFVCAQKYSGTTSQLPAGVWIGIADAGVGIPAHLRRNAKYRDIQDDRKLIQLARKPWVTGTNERRGWGLVETFENATDVGPSHLLMRSGRGEGKFRLRSGLPVWAKYSEVKPALTGTWIHLQIIGP